MITVDNWLDHHGASTKKPASALVNNAQSQSTSTQQADQTRSLTILVIEDSTDEWFLIQRTLITQFPHALVLFLSDPIQALSYLDAPVWLGQSLPAMILLDLYLPDAKAGLGLLKSIKSHPRFAKVPVITISRSNHVYDIVEVFNCGGNAYLVKPDEYQDWTEAFKLLDRY